MSDGKTIEQRRAEYEGSAIQALMEASDHEVCKRCYCCDVVYESTPCWSCLGDYDCEECDGAGQIHYRECLGRCDEQGNHKASTGANAPNPAPAP